MSSAEDETQKEGTSLLAVYDGIVFEVRGLCAYLVYELFCPYAWIVDVAPVILAHLTYL